MYKYRMTYSNGLLIMDNEYHITEVIFNINQRSDNYGN